MHPVSVDSCLTYPLCVPNLPRLGLRPHAPSPFGITKSWFTKRAEVSIVKAWEMKRVAVETDQKVVL